MSDPRTDADGVARYLARLRRDPPPALSVRSLPEARLGFDAAAQRVFPLSAAAAAVSVETIRPAGGPELRLYRHTAAPEFAVLFLHGGGFVMGSAASHDPLCRQLAASAPCIVLSAEYRLAPEHPFPAAPEDARAAMTWLSEHLDSLGVSGGRIVVMGDSAGGCLAATLGREPPLPRLQVLLYPALDLTASLPSHRTFGAGYGLDSETIEFCYAAYATPEQRRSDASPLHRHDLSAAAPAIIVVGECDPLRDECGAYAAQLRALGVPVEYVEFPHMVHGFMGMPKLFPEAQTALGGVVAAIGRHLRVETRGPSMPEARVPQTARRSDQSDRGGAP